MAVKQRAIHIIRAVFLWGMAFQVLNLSIDSIDFNPFLSQNISGFNDLNSITEYISEVVLGHVNSFPESAQKTDSKSQNIKHVDIKIYQSAEHSFVLDNQYGILLLYSFPLDETYSYLFAKEITPPPPKA